MSKKMPHHSKKGYLLSDTLQTIVFAILLTVIIRVFLFQPFFIPSESMVPTLDKQDRIIVNKLSYIIGSPKRKDIIVFKYPLNPNRMFVKRLIGLPGETVTASDGKIYINGKKLDENYLPKDMEAYDFGPMKVPDGQYLMLGDNRNNSEDSRVWGYLPEDNIVGKATLIYWPFNRMKFLK